MGKGHRKDNAYYLAVFSRTHNTNQCFKKLQILYQILFEVQGNNYSLV